jgi:hypothetical protein
MRHSINKDYNFVPLKFPVSQDGAWASDILNIKNWGRVDLFLFFGAIAKAGAVTLHQGKTVSAAATALGFKHRYQTGFMLKYDGYTVTTPFTVGETVTGGTGGGTGVVAADLGDKLVCYSSNGTAFQDNETITGGTSGRTALADGIGYNEDIMVRVAVSSDTFNVDAVASRVYCIPIDGSMLDTNNGYTCVELNVADTDTTLISAFAICMEPRFTGDAPESGIY